MLYLIFICLFLTIFFHIIVENTFLKNYIYPNSSQQRLIKILLYSVILSSLCVYIFFRDIYSFIYFFIVEAALFYTYFNFFNMSLTARRINMLINILKNNNIINFNYEYDANVMIVNRLDRLLQLNQIKLSDNHYIIIDKTFLYLGNLISFIGRIVLGNSKKNY